MSSARCSTEWKSRLTLLVAVALATAIPLQDAIAIPIAVSPGAAVTMNATTGVNAPSANCAGVQISNFGYNVTINNITYEWPNPGNGRTTGSGVISCSDASIFNGAAFPILSAKQTAQVGATILKVFPQGYAGQKAVQAGESFLYNRFVNGAGKVPQTAMASATSPSGSVASASASQTIKGATFVGKATAQYARNMPEPLSGLGIGIVNDPLDLSPLSLGTPGSVSIYLGDPTDPTDQLLLQASEPGDFATATYELVVGADTYLGLVIGITSDTNSVATASFDVTDFDAASLGWVNEASFMTALLSDFTWDQNTDTLSETAPFLLDPTPLQISADDTIVSYNYTAAAGAVVPEPSSLSLLLGALIFFVTTRLVPLRPREMPKLRSLYLPRLWQGTRASGGL